MMPREEYQLLSDLLKEHSNPFFNRTKEDRHQLRELLQKAKERTR